MSKFLKNAVNDESKSADMKLSVFFKSKVYTKCGSFVRPCSGYLNTKQKMLMWIK